MEQKSNSSANISYESVDELLANYGDNFPDATKMGDYYDQIDPGMYDDFIVKINFVVEPNAIAKMLIEELAPPKETKILDVGCGTGLMGKLLG